MLDDDTHAFEGDEPLTAVEFRKAVAGRPGDELYTIALAGEAPLPEPVASAMLTRAAEIKGLVETSERLTEQSENLIEQNERLTEESQRLTEHVHEVEQELVETSERLTEQSENLIEQNERLTEESQRLTEHVPRSSRSNATCSAEPLRLKVRPLKPIAKRQRLRHGS